MKTLSKHDTIVLIKYFSDIEQQKREDIRRERLQRLQTKISELEIQLLANYDLYNEECLKKESTESWCIKAKEVMRELIENIEKHKKELNRYKGGRTRKSKKIMNHRRKKSRRKY